MKGAHAEFLFLCHALSLLHRHFYGYFGNSGIQRPRTLFLYHLYSDSSFDISRVSLGCKTGGYSARAIVNFLMTRVSDVTHTLPPSS